MEVALAIFACEGGLQSPESNPNELSRDFGIRIEKTTLVVRLFTNIYTRTSR